MWLGLLGPFQLRAGDVALAVPAPRQRALLAALAVRVGQVVSSEALAEIMWDGAPPPGARATLRAYVMRLRRALGPELAGRVATREPGYLLEATADELDLLAFDRLCNAGAVALRAGDAPTAADLLGQALELWHGDPLADLGCESLRRQVLPRLTSQRLQAYEGRIDADLGVRGGRRWIVRPGRPAAGRRLPHGCGASL
ncbi:BTAD domain-containing putative transcriptional regulator [Pseudonocardia sp.]|uniref:AfsR/SARP family transcriptional regulator n=1 Tax=Pseudonocardia sp. TaxID=60912 RepID=UPI0031FBBE12